MIRIVAKMLLIVISGFVIVNRFFIINLFQYLGSFLGTKDKWICKITVPLIYLKIL